MSRAGANVNAAERVTRMTDDRLLLLEPVKGGEVQDHEMREIGIVQPECGPLAYRASRIWTSIGVPAVVWAAKAIAGSRMGRLPRRTSHSMKLHVVHRHGVRRHEPARLPDQDRRG
jgi:hypothetical protein